MMSAKLATLNLLKIIFKYFFNYYLAVPWPTMDHSQGDSLTNLMLITWIYWFWPKGHREPCNKVGSLSPAECLMGFKPETFWFWLQRLNSLGHLRQLRLWRHNFCPWRRQQNFITWPKLFFRCVRVTKSLVTLALLLVKLS